MREGRVSTHNEAGERLIGRLSTPENATAATKRSTVILVHGFNVTKDELGKFVALARMFTQAGSFVFRFDFSGCGQSEGDYAQTSLTKLCGDLKSIIAFVRTRPFVDGERVGIVTQSFGGPVTTALAPKVRAVVFIGTFAHPLKVIAPLFGKGYHPKGESVRTYPDGRTLKMGSQFWADLQKYNLEDSIRKITCPKFFIHGGEDENVPREEMQCLYEAAFEPKEQFIAPGLNHDWRPDREAIMEPTVAWLRRQLNIP